MIPPWRVLPYLPAAYGWRLWRALCPGWPVVAMLGLERGAVRKPPIHPAMTAPVERKLRLVGSNED